MLYYPGLNVKSICILNNFQVTSLMPNITLARFSSVIYKLQQTIPSVIRKSMGFCIQSQSKERIAKKETPFLSKTWHGSQHDNLVSTLCLTKYDFPLKDPGYAPDNIYHSPTNVHQP